MADGFGKLAETVAGQLGNLADLSKAEQEDALFQMKDQGWLPAGVLWRGNTFSFADHQRSMS